MKLQIDSNTTYREIAMFFHSMFPYLQLRFFTEPHKAGEGSARADMISTLDASCNVQGIHVYEARAEETAGDLETWFENALGLYIQVFRKSGDVWLETVTSSDSLTLVELNNRGREREIAIKQDTEPGDYHEQE